MTIIHIVNKTTADDLGIQGWMTPTTMPLISFLQYIPVLAERGSSIVRISSTPTHVPSLYSGDQGPFQYHIESLIVKYHLKYFTDDSAVRQPSDFVAFKIINLFVLVWMSWGFANHLHTCWHCYQKRCFWLFLFCTALVALFVIDKNGAINVLVRI